MTVDTIAEAVWNYNTRVLLVGSDITPTTTLERLTKTIWQYSSRTVDGINSGLIHSVIANVETTVVNSYDGVLNSGVFIVNADNNDRIVENNGETITIIKAERNIQYTILNGAI